MKQNTITTITTTAPTGTTLSATFRGALGLCKNDAISPRVPFCKACRSLRRQRLKEQALVEEELLSSVRKVVGNVYKHVRDTGRRLGDGAYLLRMGQEKREFLQLRYLRFLHRRGQLTVQEYTLLARQPHIVVGSLHRKKRCQSSFAGCFR